ncbi:MAG TPA: response regulator [Nitrososphaerales archaeon]|nr:response regulator [Nitrososphaerales archaeon]
MAVQSKTDFLIVDDSESIRLLISRMLRTLGYENIFQASTAKQALATFKERMEQSKSTIVLLDINLPDLSGDIVAKKILAMNNATKIILITAEDRTEELTMEVIRHGAFGYIQKPVRLSTLRDILEGL